MNIYFTGAILGGRTNESNNAEILKILKKYGSVLSEHIADETMSEYGETDLGKEEIHDREIERLKKSDIVVAEVTIPSLGVGYLIKEAMNLNKKVIALFNGEDSLKLSAMIKGNKNIKLHLYKSKEDLENIFVSEIS